MKTEKLKYFDQDSLSGFLDLAQEWDFHSYNYEVDPLHCDIIFSISDKKKIIGIDLYWVKDPKVEKKTVGNKNIYFFNIDHWDQWKLKTHVNNTTYYSKKDNLFWKIKIEYSNDYLIKKIQIERWIISNPEK